MRKQDSLLGIVVIFIVAVLMVAYLVVAYADRQNRQAASHNAFQIGQIVEAQLYRTFGTHKDVAVFEVEHRGVRYVLAQTAGGTQSSLVLLGTYPATGRPAQKVE